MGGIVGVCATSLWNLVKLGGQLREHSVRIQAFEKHIDSETAWRHEARNMMHVHGAKTDVLIAKMEALANDMRDLKTEMHPKP